MTTTIDFQTVVGSNELCSVQTLEREILSVVKDAEVPLRLTLRLVPNEEALNRYVDGFIVEFKGRFNDIGLLTAFLGRLCREVLPAQIAFMQSSLVSLHIEHTDR